MNAHAAVMEALYERARTGKGRGIAVSLFDSIADWMTVPLMHYEYGGKAPERVGLQHPSIAPYGAYALGDGSEVVISIQNQREWTIFCHDVLCRPDLADDARFKSNPLRVTNRNALDDVIKQAFTAWSKEIAARRLKEAGIAFGVLNSVAGLSTHSQLRRITVATENGPVTGVVPPPILEGAEFEPRAVPSIDQHGKSLREEFAA